MCRIENESDRDLFQRAAKLAEDIENQDLTNLGFLRVLMAAYLKHNKQPK